MANKVKSVHLHAVRVSRIIASVQLESDFLNIHLSATEVEPKGIPHNQRHPPK